MTSTVNLTRTAFGSNPNKALEVVDVYKQGKLDGFLANPTSTEGASLISETYPDLPADKVMNALNDPRTKALLDKTGLTLNTAVDQIKRALPEGVDVNGLLGDFDMPDLFAWAPKFKTGSDSSIFSGLDTDGYKVFFGKIVEYAGEFDIDSGLSLESVKQVWGKAAGILPGGFGSFDAVIASANTYGIAEKLIEAGLGDKVIEFIKSNSRIPDDVKKRIFTDLIKVAGEYGEDALLQELMEEAGDSVTPKVRRETIRNILYGYRIPKNTAISEMPAKSVILLNRLNLVDDKWNIYVRDNSNVGDMRHLQFASAHSLRVLSFNDATKDMALTYLNIAPTVVPEKTLAQRFIYY